MKHWPEYLPDDSELKLTPAIYQDGYVVTKDDRWECANYKRLRKSVITNGLLLFVSPVGTFKTSDGRTFRTCAESDRFATIHESTESLKISYASGRGRCWIVDSREWDTVNCDGAFLAAVREVFSHCLGIVKPTPPSLGKRLMLEVWKEHQRLNQLYMIPDTDWPGEYIEQEYWTPKRRHPLPPKSCRLALKDELTGGRVEWLTNGKDLQNYWKMDMDNALVSHYGKHPTGTAHRHVGNHNPIGFTYFVKCRVTINEKLDLGCFPYRKYSLSWPVHTGTYDCWLWKEQIEDTLRCGCTVEIIEGWSWNYFTEDNLAWTKLMVNLRESAPNEYVRKTIKRIASAAISCMGIGDARYYHVPQDEYSPELGDRRLYDLDGPLNKVVRTDRESSRPTPIHWYAYTWMQVSRTLYRLALPHAQANNLVMLHTDALWTKARPEREDGWKLVEPTLKV